MKKILTLALTLALSISLILNLSSCKLIDELFEKKESKREPCAHVFDDCADTECNECGEKRDSMHTWIDADCDTPKTCSVCNKTEGKALGHTPESDDGNCTTDIKCANCGTVLTSGKTQHVAHADDGDCTTPVTCTACETVITAAKVHDFTGEWQNDASGHWHVCKNDRCSVADVKANHISDGAATEEKAEKCTVCEYVIAPELEHTHNYNLPKYNTEGHWLECACGDKSGIISHTANTDDGDCTTAVICSGCAYIMAAAKTAHVASEDDSNCTTSIKCVNCDKIAVAGNESHVDIDHDYLCDNGDCQITVDAPKDENSGIDLPMDKD